MEGASRQSGSRSAARHPLRGAGDYAPAGVPNTDRCVAKFEQLRVAANVVWRDVASLLLPYQHELWRSRWIGSPSLNLMDWQRRGARDCATTGTPNYANRFGALRLPRLTGSMLFASYTSLIREPLLQLAEQYPRAVADLKRPRERRLGLEEMVDVLARYLHQRSALGDGNGNGRAHMLSPDKTCI